MEPYPIHHFSFPSQHLLPRRPPFSGTLRIPRVRARRSTGRNSWTGMRPIAAVLVLDDWTGFNIPPKVFTTFREGSFDP